MLIVGHAERRLYVWNSSSNTISSAVVPNSQISSQSSVSWCSKDWLAVTAGGPDVFLFQYPSLALERQFNGQQAVNEDWEEINTVAWDASCSRLAIGTSNGLFVWTSPEPRPVRIARYERGDDNEVSGVIGLVWLGPDTLAVGAAQWLPGIDLDARRQKGGHDQRARRSGDDDREGPSAQLATAGADGADRYGPGGFRHLRDRGRVLSLRLGTGERHRLESARQ